MTSTTTQSALARRSTKMKWPAVAVVVTSALFVTGLAAPASAKTLPPVIPTVALGSAQMYSIVGATTVNDGGGSTLSGSLGAGTSTNFKPASVNGDFNVANADYKTAAADVATAYDDAAGRTPTDTAAAMDIAGVTFAPGVHKFTGAVTTSAAFTLDGMGQTNPVFIFQINAAFSTAADVKANLINGANGSRVFWQVTGATALGAGGAFTGTILSSGSTVGIGAATKVSGRVLTTAGTVIVSGNAFTSTPPVIAFTGTSPFFSNKSVVTVAGTTDAPAGTAVTVTGLGSTPLNTTVLSDGTWSATSGTLPDGKYTATAAVTDVNGITSKATAVVNVKTSAPMVKINNGPSQTTDATRPTIAGSTNVPDGTPVTVVISDSSGKGNTLNATVNSNGLWSVVPATPLADGSYRIAVNITDSANNTGTAVQTLIVNTTGDSPGGTVNKSTFISGGNSRTAPAGSAFIITGTGPANSILTLHFHKRGTAVNDYSIARDVKVDADGMWSRAITASIDYRYFATANGQTSNNVLLQLV